MKAFKKYIGGYQVTNENFLEVAEKIKKQYGICPALADIALELVFADETTDNSKKGFTKSMNKAIIMLGYKPTYFTACMQKIGAPQE